jgi:translocation and assembly module TamB
MKEPQDSLRFDGRIDAVAQRSYVEQFGKRFRIDAGVVELQGKASEAQIDIRAAYRVPSTRDQNEPEATITLEIAGTMNDLGLVLGSEPQMENADIISYLATGRPAAASLAFGQNGGGGGIGSISSDLALGQVTGLVEGLAAEGVGLDVVEIQPDGLRGATLIAGRFITPRVYVGFRQPIGREPDEPGEFARTGVELEYQAVRWLLLSLEASNSVVSFLFRFRHAY